MGNVYNSDDRSNSLCPGQLKDGGTTLTVVAPVIWSVVMFWRATYYFF